MKYVTVPAPVKLLDRNGSPLPLPEATLHSFVVDMAYAKPELIGAGGAALRLINKLDRILVDAKQGDEVAVEDQDHAVMAKVLAEVQWADLRLARQQLCFIEAWENASAEKRKPVLHEVASA